MASLLLSVITLMLEHFCHQITTLALRFHPFTQVFPLHLSADVTLAAVGWETVACSSLQQEPQPSVAQQ